MAQFHFVEDYEKHVAKLIDTYPIDEAMALAVGGNYDSIGKIEVSLLRHAGLKNGMAVVDLGCGSGRLAHALGTSGLQLKYLGIDVVQRLLDYAVTKSPKHYRFVLNKNFTVPVPDQSVDMVCAFSVFTHLLHHETYLYMQDIYRALRPGGQLVFSFLEFSEPLHWNIFEQTVELQRVNTSPHLNSFIERNPIELWADNIGYIVEKFADGGEAVGGNPALGQSTAFLRRP